MSEVEAQLLLCCVTLTELQLISLEIKTKKPIQNLETIQSS